MLKICLLPASRIIPNIQKKQGSVQIFQHIADANGNINFEASKRGINLFGENLEDVIIQIAISNNVIVGFTFETEIADFETPLNEQHLYNYVLANYGAIKGSETKNWTGYKTWNIGEKEIYYAKYDQYGILEEILLVTKPEYVDLFVEPDDDGFEEPKSEN